jgi:hypothetical protein
VRRRAYALRQKLECVYATELTDARVRIEVPKGGYVPRFVPVMPPAARERASVDSSAASPAA